MALGLLFLGFLIFGFLVQKGRPTNNLLKQRLDFVSNVQALSAVRIVSVARRDRRAAVPECQDAPGTSASASSYCGS